MRPTLEVGDFILVNKFAYGLRLPIIEQKVVQLGDPQRGDVVVFRYPLNPSQDFIKRVIGVGGDVVVYRDKRLTVNGIPWPREIRRHLRLPRGAAFRVAGALAGDRRNGAWAERARHRNRPDDALGEPRLGASVSRTGELRLQLDGSGFTCKVPPGHYFMMGDNRDRSDDSRYWGFVPDDHIRGRAFFIWFNWDDISSFAWKRVGSGIR